MAAAITRKPITALLACCGAFMVMAASPVYARTDDAALSASPLGEGDSQFRALFADWKSLDGNTAPVAKVSIPSQMPLEKATLTSDFGMRIHPVLGGRRAHKGIDLAAPSGTPVYATADGLVGMAQWFSSYGNYVQIEHGAGLETRFGHLSGYTVRAGDRVTKGQLIGYVGSTGRSTGPHLHYEVRIAGDAVNPLPYMVETTAQEAFALARGEGGKGGPE
jgi:murein DD-endopeptidase MepM/ murein hydrolase activator NlpD